VEGADIAYDTNSTVALTVKRRLFDLLGLFPYQEARAEGPQVQTLAVHANSTPVESLNLSTYSGTAI
jgi:hypothetical protein